MNHQVNRLIRSNSLLIIKHERLQKVERENLRLLAEEITTLKEKIAELEGMIERLIMERF